MVQLPRRWLVAALFVLAASGRARATSEVGNLFCGPTEACAGSTWYNPASLTRARGTALWVEGGLVVIGGAYDRPGMDPGTGQPFPEVALSVLKPELAAALVSDALERRLRLALGVTIPFVDGARWPEKTPTASGDIRGPTVYHGYDAAGFSIFITPALAYEITPQIQIGAGLNVIFTSLSSRFYKDFATQINQTVGSALFQPEDPALAAPATLEGTGWGAGFTAGLTVSPLPGLRVAASYASASDTDVDVNLHVGTAPAIAQIRQELRSRMLELQLDGAGTIRWHTPQTVNAGISVDVLSNLQLVTDFQWSNSSAGSLIQARFTQRSSTLVPEAVTATKVHVDDYRVGARAVYGGFHPNLRTVLRVQYDASAVPEQYMQPVNMDFAIVSVGVGAEWRIGASLSLAADYTHFFVLSRDVQTSIYQEGPNVAEGFDLPPGNGRYSATADRIGLALRWQL